jgi:mRNA interferase MazF
VEARLRGRAPAEEGVAPMNHSQGDICWADLAEPMGSDAGFRRPVVVVQSDVFNRSRIGTAIIVPLTSNPAAAQYPGNVSLPPTRGNGLKDLSVAAVALILSVAVERLGAPIGQVPRHQLDSILRGVALVLGLAK